MKKYIFMLKIINILKNLIIIFSFYDIFFRFVTFFKFKNLFIILFINIQNHAFFIFYIFINNSFSILSTSFSYK